MVYGLRYRTMTNTLRCYYVTLVCLLRGGRELSVEKWVEVCLKGAFNFIRLEAAIMKRSTVLCSVCVLVVHIFPTEGSSFILSSIFSIFTHKKFRYFKHTLDTRRQSKVDGTTNTQNAVGSINLP